MFRAVARKGSCTILCFGLAASGIAAGSGGVGDHRAQGECVAGGRAPIRVTEDSIGALPLFAPLEQILRVCPTAVDTVFSGGQNGTGRAFPALSFRVGGLRALAVQYNSRTLDRAQPADGWIVFGSEGRLPTGIPLSSGWAVLSRELGQLQATNGGALVVRFCRLPRMLFTMQADDATLERIGDPVELEAIPPSTTIHHFVIVSPALGRAFAPC